MANKKAQRQKKHLALVSLTRRSSRVGEMIEIINRKVLFVLVFAAIGTLETALAVTMVVPINDDNFHSAIATCLGTNPVDGLCSSSEYGSMPDWDTSQITNMTGCQSRLHFPDMSSFRCIGQNRFGSIFNGNISGWNTSGVRDMSYMFYEAVAFNQNIQRWDTSQLLDMSYMFSSVWNIAPSFNQPIGDWNTSRVTNMAGMFYAASSFNQSS